MVHLVYIIAAAFSGAFFGYLFYRLREPGEYRRFLYEKRLQLYQNCLNKFLDIQELYIHLNNPEGSIEEIENALRALGKEVKENAFYFDDKAGLYISYCLQHMWHGLIALYPDHFAIARATDKKEQTTLTEEKRDEIIQSMLGLKDYLTIGFMEALGMLHLPFRREGINRLKKMDKELKKIFPGRKKTIFDF